MTGFNAYPKMLLLIVLLASFVAGCAGGNSGAQSPANALTAFSLGSSTGTVDETAKSIAVLVPYNTTVTAAVATFTSTGASAQVGGAPQTSGKTANDFSSSVVYTITAADGSTQNYTVTASKAPITGKAVTSYTLAGVTGTVDETAKTISVTMPNGTNLARLIASFTTTGASVQIGGTDQVSGTTTNDFGTPLTYTVTAGDHSAASYVVTVTTAPSDAKAITAFSVASVAGVIDPSANTITVTLPFGTKLTPLVATFTSTGTSVKIATAEQKSGITANDFTTTLTYIVTASDGTTAPYAVTVTAAADSAAAITAFSLARVVGTVDALNKTITVIMPNVTDLTALIATFTTTGSSVTVGSTVQKSGTTPNDFTGPLTYLVTAADKTSVPYTVTVTKAAASAKAITAFSFPGATGVIDSGAGTITATLPSGTPVTGLVATFTRTGTSITVGSAPQTSGITANDFTAAVKYTVTAADQSTADYLVTVNLGPAKGPAVVNLGTAGSYVVLAETKIANVPTSAITGNLGISPAAISFITGFSLTKIGTTSATASQVTGNLTGGDMDAPTSTNLTTAISDMGTAYTDAAGRPTPDHLNLGTGELGGLTLAPGLYKWTTGVTISSDLTFSGGPNDVWILQIPGNLRLNPAKHVFLLGGAQAKNIFWQVAGAASIGTTAHFEGIILSQTSITLETGASMNGRALAQSAVVLDSNALTQPN